MNPTFVQVFEPPIIPYLRALVVDDEPGARKALVSLLQRDCPEVVAVTTAHSVENALRKIRSDAFDVVFLDIHLLDGSGLDLLRTLGTFDFQVVFVTAHDAYALQAFELSALDYVLKPINRNKLKHAVEKVKQRLPQVYYQQQITWLLERLQKHTPGKDKLVLRSTDEMTVVDLTEVRYLQAQVNYTCIYLTGKRKVMQSKTLKEFDRTLSNQPGFLRIHKSYLVNVNEVKSISRSGRFVTLKGGEQLLMAPGKKDVLLSMY